LTFSKFVLALFLTPSKLLLSMEKLIKNKLGLYGGDIG
jgi:hypothetical protein